MSVSQVKKRFEEMATYLGRDATGLEKLRQLKDAVNVLRTKLAAAEESAAQAIESKAHATAKLVETESELADCRRDSHRLTQKMENVSRDLETVQAMLPREDTNPVDQHATKLERQVTATAIELRRNLKKCPKPTATNTYDRKLLSKGWSRQEIWTLGAAVAALAAINGEVTIFSTEALADIAPSEKAGLVLLGWFASNLGTVVTDGFDDVCAGYGEAPSWHRAVGFRS